MFFQTPKVIVFRIGLKRVYWFQNFTVPFLLRLFFSDLCEPYRSSMVDWVYESETSISTFFPHSLASFLVFYCFTFMQLCHNFWLTWFLLGYVFLFGYDDIRKAFDHHVEHISKVSVIEDLGSGWNSQVVTDGRHLSQLMHLIFWKFCVVGSVSWSHHSRVRCLLKVCDLLEIFCNFFVFFFNSIRKKLQFSNGIVFKPRFSCCTTTNSYQKWA